MKTRLKQSGVLAAVCMVALSGCDNWSHRGSPEGREMEKLLKEDRKVLTEVPKDFPVQYAEGVDRSAFKEVGNGSLDFKALLAAAQKAKVEHYFVEQDQTPGDPVDSLRQSYEYLRKLA